MSVPPPWPGQHPPKKGPSTLKVILLSVAGVVGAIVVLSIVASLASGGGSRKPAAGTRVSPAAGQPSTPEASQAPKAKPKPVRHTVTYIVTGSPSDVEYGPAGSDLSGPLPLHVTRILHHPEYYSITAQLDGGGKVICKILVDGKVISRAQASGAYNIASCEIDKDPFSGKWENSNSG